MYEDLNKPDNLIDNNMINNFNNRLIKKTENKIIYDVDITGLSNNGITGSNIDSDYYQLN